jgi:hypothetical protein
MKTVSADEELYALEIHRQYGIGVKRGYASELHNPRR